MASQPSELLKTLQTLTGQGKIDNDALLPMILAAMIDLLQSVDKLTTQQETQEHVPSQVIALAGDVSGLKAWKVEVEKERAKLIGVLIGAAVAGGATGGGIVAIILKALGG